MPKSGNFSPAFLGSLTPAVTVKKDILNYLQKEHGIDEEFIFAEEGFDKNLEDYIRSFKI